MAKKTKAPMTAAELMEQLESDPEWVAQRDARDRWQKAQAARLAEELGIRTPLTYLYKFQYHAQYESVGSEREYCWVYYGRHDGDPDVNLNEIADRRYIDVDGLDAELAETPDDFTPWLKLEWTELKAAHLPTILSANT